MFAVFAHRFQGGGPARHLLHGVVVSPFACAVFFLLVATCLGPWSLVATFNGAALYALLTQGGRLWLVRRRPRAADQQREGWVSEEREFRQG